MNINVFLYKSTLQIVNHIFGNENSKDAHLKKNPFEYDRFEQNKNINILQFSFIFVVLNSMINQ